MSLSTKVSTPFSHSSATTSSQKSKGKRSHYEAFVDDNKAEAMVLASMNADKHTRKMAEYQHRMAELEFKKQRITLEAQGKQLEADERRIAAQYQREREKEKHEMEMLKEKHEMEMQRLRVQLQGGAHLGGSGVSGLDANTAQYEQFPASNPFGSLGGL
jgi:hypothetical protein